MANSIEVKDLSNRLEALREAKSDEKQGADFLMVKPALAFLDILRELRQETWLQRDRKSVV